MENTNDTNIEVTPSLKDGEEVFYKTLHELGTVTDFEVLDKKHFIQVRFKSDGNQKEFPLSSHKLLLALLICGHSIGMQWSQP